MCQQKTTTVIRNPRNHGKRLNVIKDITVPQALELHAPPFKGNLGFLVVPLLITTSCGIFCTRLAIVLQLTFFTSEQNLESIERAL